MLNFIKRCFDCPFVILDKKDNYVKIAVNGIIYLVFKNNKDYELRLIKQVNTMLYIFNFDIGLICFFGLVTILFVCFLMST